eukprot:5258512-Pyramimonas_sp.AAC.1
MIIRSFDCRVSQSMLKFFTGPSIRPHIPPVWASFRPLTGPRVLYHGRSVSLARAHCRWPALPDARSLELSLCV